MATDVVCVGWGVWLLMLSVGGGSVATDVVCVGGGVAPDPATATQHTDIQ